MRWFGVGFAVLGIATFGVYAADVHKWVDDAGVTHYGEAAPGDRASTAIATPEAQPSSSAPMTTQERLDAQNRVIDQLSEERIQRREEKEKAVKAKLKHDRECEVLLRRQATLKDGGRIYRTNPNGQREYLTDDVRKQRLAETDEQLKKQCR